MTNSDHEVAQAVHAALTEGQTPQRRHDGEKIQEALRKIDVPRRLRYSEQFRESLQYRQVFHRLLAHADDLHAQYSQYAGHWDKWKLGKMKRHVAMKGGATIYVGDYVLISPQAGLQQLEGGAGFCATIYDCRTGYNCSVQVEDVEIL